MESLRKINVDLLVPLLIVFALLRLKKYYCFPQKLFCGLRFFVSNICLSQKHLRTPHKATNVSEQSFVESKLHDFNLSMIELDGSVRKGSILSTTLLYDSYETLVYLSLSSVFVHFFSVTYHCYSPTSIYSIWGSIFVSFSVILPFRLLIRILLMTGFAAFESRVAITVSVISFFGSAMLLFGPFDALRYPLENVLSTTAVHCNALMLQLSSTAVQPTEPVMIATIKIFLSFLTAMTALGMVLPALLFAQSFNTLLFGARYEKAPVPIQVLITIDHFLPLFVAASMTPEGLILLSGTLPLKADARWLCLQLFATMLMVAVRLSCMKRHLQCFLDVAVRTISTEMATSASANVKDIQDKVAARFQYIPNAAIQYLSAPFCALGLVLLVHKSAPAGTGICVDVRSILGMDTETMTAASASLLAHNATAAALHMTSNGEPTFMSGMHLFLMSAGENNISPTSELRAFFIRLTSDLHLLPVGAFVTLGRLALCVHCFLWFTISSTAIIYWYFNPISLKRASGYLLLKKEQ